MPRIIDIQPSQNGWNRIKGVWKYFQSFESFTKVTILTCLLIILATPFIVRNYQNYRSRASFTHDLKSYYPNPDMYQTYYLEGYNYINSQSPIRAVLWFEPQDQWSFKMYNSAPEDVNSRCHWDLLSWWDDGFFRYTKTHHECPGTIPNEVVYNPPIVFLPRYWNETSGQWTFSGSSNTTYYENATVACQGVNSYTATLIGLEEIAPNTQAIHWRTQQNTNWTSGNVPGKCTAGYTTHWQEDYWLYPSLPVEGGGTAKALKRTKGGNLDITSDSWDVWFDYWRHLPTPTPAPTATPTPTLTPTPTPIPPDTTKPTVSITSPVNGGTVKRKSTVTIATTASDNVSVTKVQFYVSGILTCTDTTSPYSCPWSVPNTPNKTYQLQAKAYDPSNNIGSSSIVTVTAK